MKIAKAVVLAGECGGSTPWPSMGIAARQLAPVANRPVLFHHLDALQSAGVTEAAIVTDAVTGASIRAAVGDGSDWELDVTHLEYHGTADVIASASVSAFVGGAPVIVQHGDVLMRERLTLGSAPMATGELHRTFPHQRAGHCGSGALRDLLEHRGLDFGRGPLSEGAVFGLGGGVGFLYMEDIPAAGTPIYLVGRTADLEREIAPHLGIDLDVRATDDPAEG